MPTATIVKRKGMRYGWATPYRKSGLFAGFAEDGGVIRERRSSAAMWFVMAKVRIKGAVAPVAGVNVR